NPWWRPHSCRTPSPGDWAGIAGWNLHKRTPWLVLASENMASDLTAVRAEDTPPHSYACAFRLPANLQRLTWRKVVVHFVARGRGGQHVTNDRTFLHDLSPRISAVKPELHHVLLRDDRRLNQQVIIGVVLKTKIEVGRVNRRVHADAL